LTFVNERPLAIQPIEHCLEFAPNDHLKPLAEDLLCHFRADPTQTEDSMLESAILVAILALMTTVPSP
jgi:hypothetical protein